MKKKVQVMNKGMVDFIEMVIEKNFGKENEIKIKDGVQDIMVMEMGKKEEGMQRMKDVMVGEGVGILLRKILMKNDKVRVIEREVRGIMEKIERGIKKQEEVIKEDKKEEEKKKIKKLIEEKRELVEMREGIEIVRRDERWQIRGRMVESEIKDMERRYERRGIRIYEEEIMFGEEMGNEMRKKEKEKKEWMME